MARHATRRGSGKRERTAAPGADGATPGQALRGASRRFREVDVLALLVVALMVWYTWLARNALNPDGVSYLDLSAALRRGDFAAFVQGYWSPLYPMLIALGGAVTGAGRGGLVAIAHIINGVAALAALTTVWWWGRRSPGPYAGRALIAAFLLASAGLPRIEAVTPDLLLFAAIVAIGYELLVHRGERWLLLGVLFGVAFAAKTSTWPWLLVAVPVRWLAWPAQRRAVWRATAVGAVLALGWIVPMSVKYQRPTFGSAARLNYCWYLERCDSRSPDTHTGMHRDYHSITVADTLPIRWVTYDTTAHWTYPPWSDPTAWNAGVTSVHRAVPCAACHIAYWIDEAGYVFGLWLLPLLAGVIVPLVVIARRRGMWSELGSGSRDAAAVMVLGVIGLLQFVAVHAEPRLIAPFGMLLAIGAVEWLTRRWSSDAPPRGVLPQLLSLVGLGAAIGVGIPRVREGLRSSGRIATVANDIQGTAERLRERGIDPRRIVVIGPVLPVEPSIYIAGAEVVAQIPPRSAIALGLLGPEVESQVVARLFSHEAAVAWLTSSNGGVTIAIIPPPPP